MTVFWDCGSRKSSYEDIITYLSTYPGRLSHLSLRIFLLGPVAYHYNSSYSGGKTGRIMVQGQLQEKVSETSTQ
jgi:hypothetical protein